MRIANLEARREWHEIEREGLTRAINSSLATAAEREVAIERRDALRPEWAAIVEELKNLQRKA